MCNISFRWKEVKRSRYWGIKAGFIHSASSQLSIITMWIHVHWSVDSEIDKFIFHIVIPYFFYPDIHSVIMLHNYALAKRA